MNLIAAFRLASLAVAAMVVGTLAASAAADAAAKHGPAAINTSLALNPQPLPPIIDDHDFDAESFFG